MNPLKSRRGAGEGQTALIIIIAGVVFLALAGYLMRTFFMGTQSSVIGGSQE